MNNDKIAVFGSAFNPPHLGHGDVVSQILEIFDKVILVPSFHHAFGKKMMPFDLRVKMVNAMVADMALYKRANVSEIEKSISQNLPPSTPVYTYDVMAALEKQIGTSDLTFIVGPDNAAPEAWAKFNRADEILQRWQVWSAAERLHVRSTSIRDKLEKGALPTRKECNKNVIELLAEYFNKN